MNRTMNAQASASTSMLPLPWSEESQRGPHALHLPFSASTPVVTLSSPTALQGHIMVEEPEELALGSPRSPRVASPRPQQVQPRPVAPSQSNNEALHLALVLAFGNDKYSGALAPSPPTRRPYSTPPGYLAGRAKTPVKGMFSNSPGSTPPHSPSSTPKQRDSRDHPYPSSASTVASRLSDSSDDQDFVRHSPHRARSTPPPPLDLRFESDYYSSDSPTSAHTTGSLGAQFRTQARRSTYNLNSQPLRKPEGTLMLPIPLMLRPRPIWRTTPRSALSSPAYAPASHLVRRSTFVAAGLDLDAPVADLSALGVETRALMFGRDAGVVLPGFEL